MFFALSRVGLLDDDPPTVSVTRITGEDPISASASVARQSHGGGAPIVVIAGTEAVADGVVGAGLAGSLDAPILLNESGVLSPQIIDVLRELDTERAILIGGTNGLSALVESTLEIELELEVTRIAGPSRFDTAASVADLFVEQTEPATVDGLRSALIVPAENVPAGLEAGSLAASRATPLPILISQEGRLNEPTRAAIDRLDIEQLFIVPAGFGVPNDVATDFDGPIREIRGINGAADMAIEIRDFRPPRVVIVPGGDQARTLVAAPLAGSESGVILTVETAQEWLSQNCGTLSDMFVIAEPDIASDDFIAAAEQSAVDCAED